MLLLPPKQTVDSARACSPQTLPIRAFPATNEYSGPPSKLRPQSWLTGTFTAAIEPLATLPRNTARTGKDLPSDMECGSLAWQQAHHRSGDWWQFGRRSALCARPESADQASTSQRSAAVVYRAQSPRRLSRRMHAISLFPGTIFFPTLACESEATTSARSREPATACLRSRKQRLDRVLAGCKTPDV